jgi:aminoglycoside phosphotransferase (APT) family kinase protein
LHVGTDTSVLGGAFNIMPLVEGRTLLSDTALLVRRGPQILAETHARLHAIDPAPLRHALEAAGVDTLPSDPGAMVALLRPRTAAPGLEGLRAGLHWLETHQPGTPSSQAVLHLDFHPGNILIQDGRVTGVIDWPNMALGDPASDVATTRVLLTTGPVDVPGWARPPMNALRHWIARRYTSAYRKRRPLSAASLRYYEARRCFIAMLRTSELRLARPADEGIPPETYAWGGPEQVHRMTTLFERHTKTPLILPPPPR